MIHQGDALETLVANVPSCSVDVVVTSPPYWRLRDYGAPGQIGWEPNPRAFVERVAAVLAEAARALRPHGLMWVVFDDKRVQGTLANTDARLVLALEARGVEKLHEVVWTKPSTKPNGSDSLPAHAFEKVHVFKPLVRGTPHYWDAYRATQDTDDGHKRRLTDVWEIAVGAVREKREHEAMFPPKLARRCLELSTSAKGYCSLCRAPWRRNLERGDPALARRRTLKPLLRRGWIAPCDHDAPVAPGVALDPFCGSGRTGVEAVKIGLEFVGIDLSRENAALARRNLGKVESGR